MARLARTVRWPWEAHSGGRARLFIGPTAPSRIRLWLPPERFGYRSFFSVNNLPVLSAVTMASSPMD